MHVFRVLTGALLVAPIAVFVSISSIDGWNRTVVAPTEHFYVVSTTALLAAAIGGTLLWSVRSVRETRTLFLGLGFTGLGLIFAAHGLSTPGFIVPAGGYPYGVIVSAGLSQIIAAALIFLSVLPDPWLPARRIPQVAPYIILGSLTVFGTYVTVTLMRPETWEIVPRGDAWDTFLSGSAIAFLAGAAQRYWQAWRLTRFPGQFAMVASLILLGQSQVSMYFGEPWRIDWWLYHALLLAAFLTLIGGWAIEARRAGSLLLFSRSIALRERLDQVDLANPETLEALEDAMAGKDQYTRDHMGRVAEYARAIAEQLGADERTKRLAQVAGRIHDVGKIAVPDDILLKPGKLTTEEFEQMKHHAARGAMIVRTSRVLNDVAEVVRAHHERFAGGGYPDGLAGEAIPLAARIVAVADTFDALTSPRVYRGARPTGEAIAELRRVAGTQLDPRCVEAFLGWLERENTDEQRAAA